MTKREISNQTVGKYYGLTPQTLSDHKRSNKIELNRRVEALYDGYKKFLEKQKEEKWKS